MNTVNENIQEILADIFENSERPDKMTISLNPLTKAMTIIYDDLDEEWFNELWNNGA